MGSCGRTWISRLVTVGFLLYRASDAVSEPIFSKMSLMKEFMMDMAFEEIPVSCTFEFNLRQPSRCMR